MIQATDNDLLRAAGAQSSAAQLMQEALRSAAQSSTAMAQPMSGGDSSEVDLSDASRLLNALQAGDSAGHPVANALSKLMEQLTGQKVADISIGSQSLQASSFSMDTVEEYLRLGSRSGLDYQYRSLHAEGQQLSYSATGRIELEDGTELTFEFKLEMSRVHVEETRARVQVDGAALREALGAGMPGLTARPREKGFDVDIDHRGIRRLLEGLTEPEARHHGRGRAQAHPDDDQRGRLRHDHDHHHERHGKRERSAVEPVA